MKTKLIGFGGIATVLVSAIFYFKSEPKDIERTIISETVHEEIEADIVKPAIESQKQEVPKATVVTKNKEEAGKTKEKLEAKLVKVNDHGARSYKINDTQITVTPSGQIFLLPEDI